MEMVTPTKRVEFRQPEREGWRRDEYFFGLDDKWSPLPGEFQWGRWKMDGIPPFVVSSVGPREEMGFRIFLYHQKHGRPLCVCQVRPQRHGLRRDIRMFNNEELNCACYAINSLEKRQCASKFSGYFL